ITRNKTPMLQPSGMTWRGVGTAVSSRASGPFNLGDDGLTNLYSHSPVYPPRTIMSEQPAKEGGPLASKSAAWSGRFDEPVADFVLRYTASIGFDRRLALADIEGSLAHAGMLHECGIISAVDLSDITRGLQQIRGEIVGDQFNWRLELEDVHLNIERRLTELVGDAGKRLHTGRSRNDQIATDTRLWLRGEIDHIVFRIYRLQHALVKLADRHA